MKNLIFDVHNIAWRSYYAKAYSWRQSSRGLSGHIYGSIRQVLKMIRRAKTKDFKLVFAYDKWPKRKLDLDPDYKGQRTKPDFNPVPDVKALYNMIPSEIVYADDEECDDTIASYIHTHKNDINIINTTDKDLWQLLNQSDVYILTDHIIDKIDIRKKFKLPLEQCHKIAIYKAIYGDAGDNIPNLCTRFRWKDIEQVFLACDGTPDSFIAETKKLLPEKKYNKLMEKVKRFKLNYDLACLRKNLDYTSISNEGDMTRLKIFLMNWGCHSMWDDLVANLIF